MRVNPRLDVAKNLQFLSLLFLQSSRLLALMIANSMAVIIYCKFELSIANGYMGYISSLKATNDHPVAKPACRHMIDGATKEGVRIELVTCKFPLYELQPQSWLIASGGQAKVPRRHVRI